jgi:hypothetical protein
MPMLMSWRGSLLLAMTLLATAAGGAFRYRFSSEGSYGLGRHQAGSVIIDGDRWRIDYDLEPTDATTDGALIAAEPDHVISLNAVLKTWHNVPGRTALTSTLFSLGTSNAVSKVRVSRKSLEDYRFDDGRIGKVARIEFAYRIASETMGEKIGGEVSGEARVWTAEVPGVSALPWPAFAVYTGFKDVDDAFRDAVAAIPLTPVQSEVRIARKLDGGAPIVETIHRKVSDFATVTADPDAFKIPAGYRFQETVIGIPGASKP